MKEGEEREEEERETEDKREGPWIDPTFILPLSVTVVSDVVFSPSSL